MTYNLNPERARKLTGCVAAVLAIGCPSIFADDWPQWRGPNRDGVWHETGIIEAFAGPQIEHAWRAEVSNGYSGPTVADGRVYLTDRVVEPEEVERVLCFDAATGEALWTHAYETTYRSVGYRDGPRTSVTIADGRAYAFGTMGHFRALDAVTGELLWKKDPGVDYDIPMPSFGMCAAPIVVGDKVIVQMGAREGACIVAMDTRTGVERWRALDDRASYSAPILIEQGGQPVLVCWTGGHIAGLNPGTGEVLWALETPPRKGVINIATPIVDGDRMFLTSFYDGSYMLRLGQDAPSIETIWRRVGRSEFRTDALHSINSTPLMLGDHVYGVDSYGEFRCLEASTGDRVWEDLSVVPKARWATIHMVRNGNRVWMFNELGELIITELSPNGLHQVSRAKLIGPTAGQYTGTFSAVNNPNAGGDGPKAMFTNDTGVTWSHPAFANRHVFVRNDSYLVCANLAAE